MATSILRKVHYQKLHRFYVVLNSQQNASHFLKKDTVSPLCASVRFCSNTPTDKAGSASTKNERQKEEKKTIYLPGTSASYLSPQINQIAEKTGASLKLTDQSTAEKKIPVVITAASPEDIQKAVKEINEVLQAHLAEIRSAQPVQERLEELVFIPRDKAGFLLDEKSSSLLDVQNETATQIKVMSDLQDEQILLVLTGPGQQNITEAMEKIKQLVLQRPKETVKLDHPPFNQFMKLITSMQETGVRIQLDRTQDGDVAKIFAKTREELEDAKAKIQESMDSVRSRAFTFETDTSAWNRFIGKEGANINRIRQKLLEVDPSLSLNTVQNKRKQVTAVYLFGSRDVSEDKFEEAASMVNEEMKGAEKAFGKSKQPRQRLKEMDFEFETESPNAMNVFIGKQGSNINLLLEELRKLDSSIAFKRFSNKIVRLLYPDGMDADKLKEAESLVRERMVEIEEYLETRQAPQREKGKKQISFEAASNEVWHMLIGKNESSINAIIEKVKKIDPSLRCELKKPRIFLISDGSVAEDKFEEAASIINAALEGKQKYLDLFVNDVKGKESCKHQIFKPATDRTWRMLIGREGQNFYRIIQNLEKIDSSLNLQIIRSDISIYNGIILWSKENVDDEKFKKAVSVVKGEIAKIEKSITGNTDREGFKKKTFTFETRGPQAMSHFVGSRGSNIKALLQELHLLNSNMTIEQKGDSSFQLLYPEDMEENDLEEATHIIDKEVNRIKEFFDIFTTDIKDKQSGKNRIFKFTTDSKEAWNRLIGKEGYYFKKIIRHIKTVNPALDLHIVSPDPSTEQSVILWTKENVDDEQFERAASMIDEVLERVEMSVKGSRPEQPRMSDFKTMTFEFENPRERVIRFFIGANGVNINKVKDELRMINPGFGIRVQKDMTIQFIYPNDADEHHLSLAEALVTKSMNEIEKGTGLSARRRTGNLSMDRDMIGHLVGPDNSNINKLRAKIQKVDPSAEIFVDQIRGDVKLYGTEQSFETIESLVYKEVDNIRKSQLIEPVMRDEFEGLDQLLDFNDPMSTTTQSHVEEIKLTERMRDILLDSKTMKLKEIQHLLIKRGKEATIQETQQSLRLHASTKEDLEEISALIHEAVTNESGKFTKVVKITPGIWMALMEGKGQELQDKYGTRLLTSKLNSADTDNLEIVYENPKQLELVTSEKTELKNSYKVHLNLAASEDDIWELIKDVFTAFEHGCIKGQKRSEQCSQYCFWHFSKVKRKDLKILLLTRFKNGDLIPEEFRSACQRCERESTTEVPEEKSPTKRMKTTSQKRKANDEAETESITKCKRSKKKMAEKETQIDSDNKEIKELKQKIVTMSEKLRCTEQSLIEQKHLVKEKDGKIVVLKKQLISVVTKAEEQKVMVANLNKRIIDLEKELEVEIQNRLHAEEAAVRARQNTQITPTSQQKSLEKRKSVPDDLPRVRSAGEKKVKGLHNPNVLSHQVFVRSEEYKQLMTHEDEVLRDIQTQAHCFVDIDDVKEKRGGKGGVVTILAKSRLDLDSAVTKINQFVGYSVPNIEQRSKRVPKEKPQKYFLDHQELEYLFSEALDKREITDTQFINIPEDFSFDTMESSNIWTKEDLKKPSRQDTTDNLYYQLLRERKENLLTNRIPYNGYEEMIKLTNEGKMWHYPIDNEQGMDEEKAVSFAEHVFFDDMLEDFPKSGPIRNYMEQVTVGLSQNPHLTVEEKREHVAWYKNYFQGKAETLKDFFGETGELKDFLSKENSKQKKESTSD